MKFCNIPECERKMIARGWCHTHYKRWQVHGDPLINTNREYCSIEGCEKKHSYGGYCFMHMARFKRHGDPLYKADTRGLFDNLIDIFKYRVIKNNDGCWGWAGAKTSFGYGVISYNGKNHGAHRVSYEMHIGKIPSNMQVLHLCDNPECTNPSHLFLGDQKDNVQDCIKKNRFKRVPDKCKVKGERVHGSKLSSDDVIRIKQLIEDGYKNTVIASMFNVTHGNISSIRCGHTWKHIKKGEENVDPKIQNK